MDASPEMPAGPGFTGRDMRDAVGRFPTGVTVVTSQEGDHPYGMTANAFTSVSLDPPLILLCVIKGTDGCRIISDSGVFAVNILSEAQEPLSRYFSSRTRPRGRDAFDGIRHSRGTTGSPILADVASYLDCRLTAQHDAGDHVIFIGEVLDLAHDVDASPLVFHSGQYRRVEPG